MGGEGQNEVGFFVKFPLLVEIQFLSHKLLARQASNHHHFNQHAQKPMYKQEMIWKKQTLS